MRVLSTKVHSKNDLHLFATITVSILIPEILARQRFGASSTKHIKKCHHNIRLAFFLAN